MKFKLLPLVLVLGLILSACDSTEPDEGPGEEELITKVTLTLKSDGLDDVVAIANDPDGDGADFTIDDLLVDRNTVYTGEITFEDGINNENITEEVRDEADEHQVHYLPETILDIAVAATDEDSNGHPIGLSFTLTTVDATSGILRVVLSHYDDSPKDGTSLSDESDVDINFPVVVGGIVGGG